MICAPSKDSDQPGYPSSVVRRSSLCAQWVVKDPVLLQADREDSDQTGRMPRLILVVAGRTNHFVDFVMGRLKLRCDADSGVNMIALYITTRMVYR